MAITIRAIEDLEIELFRSNLLEVFGFDPSVDPQGAERFRALVDLSRTYCAFDGARMVASAASFTFDLSVPGATVPMGGLTMVTVRPTHKRRGILRSMMAAHLADVSARSEPLSGLWASEGSIYGRFGFGMAAEGDELKFSGFAADLTQLEPLDEVMQLSDDEAARELPALHTKSLALRPGMFTRTPAWWHYRRFTDRPDVRKGRSHRMHVVCRRAGEATGYVVYRLNLGFDDGTASGQLDIEELVALDARAEATLYQFVGSVDLFPNVSWWNAPTDSLLPWLLRDRRAAVRKRRADTLWLRLCDVPSALSARRYAFDGRLALSVDGQTYELEVNDGVGRCRQAELTPQLSMSLSTLGTLYLGNTAPSLLGRAGLIRGTDRGLAEADRMFTWPVAPWCPEIF